MKTAEEIVKALADWSNKYPRGRVYSMNKMSMDEELIEIENIAKEYANQSREEGSGKLLPDYWKERCLLAETCLEKSPCDPDINSEQIEAWNAYHNFIRLNGNNH